MRLMEEWACLSGSGGGRSLQTASLSSRRERRLRGGTRKKVQGFVLQNKIEEPVRNEEQCSS